MPLSSPELFSGFSKLSYQQRLKTLERMTVLMAEDAQFLHSGGLQDSSLAENFIENVIGYFQLPLGVACYFRIDEKDYAIPMAVEETSIVAALSKSAKWIRQKGRIETSIVGDTSIGQLQIHRVNNFAHLKSTLETNKRFLIEKSNEEITASLKQRGGGLKDIQLRQLGDMAVIHLYIDCCDAMGANIINQTLEYLKPFIEKLTGETITLCILSNLNDSKISKATVTIHDIDKDLGQRIEDASRFAECDPYRAATHNKGVMNGIDPVLIATGNDWRAVEAGVHAYAARTGQYRAITTWRYQQNTLIGKFAAPICVGTVGGVTTLHPTARLCLNMLGTKHADELSRVLAAVGLVQNLGALRALTTEGIIQGHMRLHIDNLVLATGANQEESIPLKAKLEQLLQTQKRLTQTQANSLLSHLRKQQYA